MADKPVRADKATAVAELTEQFRDSAATLLTEYRGLTVAQLKELRRNRVLEELPVLVKDVDDQAAAAMALIENIQREDLNPLEEAQGIHRLITDFHFTHEQAAGAVGRSRSAVSNLLRLLNLAKPVQTMLMAGDIDMGHARALLATDSATQITLANQIVAKRMSVREAEKLVVKTTSEQKNDKPRVSREKSRDIARLEEELSDTLATLVAIKLNAKNRGQLIIDFADLDMLDGVIAKLRA